MNCSNFNTHGREYLDKCVKYCSFIHYNQVHDRNRYTYYVRDILIKQYVSLSTLSKYVIIMNRNCEHGNWEWGTGGKSERSLH